MRAIFDLDGTLVDSAPDIHATALTVLQAEGLPPISEDLSRSFIGNGAKVFVERLELATAGDARPERTARMQALFLRAYENAHSLSRPYRGVADALETLTARGWRMAVCTNKPLRPTMALLEHFGWTGLFQAVIGGDSLRVMKPNPAPLHAAAAALGTGPLVYIGDSEVDADTAQAASIPFALYLGGYRRRDLGEMRYDCAFADWANLPDLAAALAR